jgi:predicted nucleotidyltransferase
VSDTVATDQKNVLLHAHKRESAICNSQPNSLEEIIRKIKEKIEPLAKAAWMFGSCVDGNNTDKSDVDLVVVVPNGMDELSVEEKLEEIHRRENVDTTFFHEKDVEIRAAHNDYLLASILEKEKFLFGDREWLYKNKETIFSKEPTKESVKFNILEALHDYDMALIIFENFKYYCRTAFLHTNPEVEVFKKMLFDDSFTLNFPDGFKDYDFEIAKGFLLQTARNCVLALGHNLASRYMQKERKTITLNYLLENNELYRDVYNYQKSCRRKREVDPNVIKNLMILTYNVLNGETYGTV